MAAVGTLHHHATGKYATGYIIMKVCFYYRGVTIVAGSWLYVKQEHAAQLEIPFQKLTELAAEAIQGASLPMGFAVTVLFDAFYLCPKVAQSCKVKGWHYIAVGKSNRWFTIGAVKRKLGRYGHNVLRNSDQWYSIAGLRTIRRYRLAQRVGRLNGLGMVKVVFSRRRRESKHIALVTDDLGASMRTIVAGYLKRWSIELLIKDQKQHSGLGDYRVRRYQAIVRHLRLVDVAYACLTHVAIKTCRAQSRNKSDRVLQLEPISKLKDCIRQIVWQQNVQGVIKYSDEKPVVRRSERLLAA